jgi:MFS family permease
MKLLTENQNINKLSYGFAFLFMTIGAILQYITPYFNQLGKEDIGFKVLTLLYFSIFIANSFAPYFIQKYGTRKMILITAITYIISISSIIVNN